MELSATSHCCMISRSNKVNTVQTEQYREFGTFCTFRVKKTLPQKYVIYISDSGYHMESPRKMAHIFAWPNLLRLHCVVRWKLTQQTLCPNAGLMMGRIKPALAKRLIVGLRYRQQLTSPGPAWHLPHTGDRQHPSPSPTRHNQSQPNKTSTYGSKPTIVGLMLGHY